MTELDAREEGPRNQPPRGSQVPCATCGGPVDPLRAARVALFGEHFCYFCSADCRRRFAPPASIPARRRPPKRPAPPAPETSGPDATSRKRDTAAALADVEADELERLATPLPAAAGGLAEDPETADSIPVPRPEQVVEPLDIGTLLVAIAVVSAILSIGLALAGDSIVALTARVVLVVAGAGSFVARALSPGHDPSEPHPVVIAAAPVVSAGAALAGRLGNAPATPEATTLAGLVIALVAGSTWLMQRARSPVDLARANVAEYLDRPGRRVLGDEVVSAPANDLRPGEEIILEAGEVAVVDATLIAGEATVLPWLGAKTTALRGEGDPIVAGATVVEGRVRAIVGWSGSDRAWMRLTNDPRRRADVFAPLARMGRLLSERGAIVGATVAALAAFSSDRPPLVIVLFAVAAFAVFANASVAQAASLYVARAVLAALRRGIVFRTAEALDRAGRVSTGIFCARGTLLLGEPEVASIDALGSHDAEQVLALLAGAESGATHPTAVAILRAARARGIRPDGVRSPTTLPGLGVTAVASGGQQLVVGSRALMLRERISVAIAESKIVDLEAMGRSVILVALGGRLVGVVGLQDGLRPGARAAVQHLLDVGVEPVLISGDARETCEALGRAVDIDHIRPELLPNERGDEVRRLSEGGAVVAVFGRSPADDVALSAGDVSVALGSAGASSAEWSVQLAADDVRDAAFAIRAAHRCRREAVLALVIALAPGVAAALAVAIGLLAPAVAPLAAMAATAAVVLRLRLSAR